MSWQPVLDGELRDEALSTVIEVAKALGRVTAYDDAGPSLALQVCLAGGVVGHALAASYLAGAGIGEAGNCESLLNVAIDALNSTHLTPSLYSGFSGIAWAVEHLFGPFEVDDPNEDADNALAHAVARSPWEGSYDLIDGLVGYGVYALERPLSAPADLCLARIVERFEELQVQTEQGVTWLTPAHQLVAPLRPRYPNGRYELGAAHGVAGIIAFLGDVWARGVKFDSVRQMMEGAVQWLLAQTLPSGSRSQFPDAVAEGTAPDPSRTAWCWGDPGIAAALARGAVGAGRADWLETACVIARRAAVRPSAATGVKDAGLCHGALGLALIYAQFFHLTGDRTFREAAAHWTRHALASRSADAGLAGFRAWRGSRGWSDESGLLTGASGIALALLSLASDVEPRWSRIFLLPV